MLIFSRYSWWLGAMAGFALLLTLMGQVGLLGPIQGVYLVMTEPLERLSGAVFRPVASLISDAGDLDDIRDENQRLRLENESLRAQVVELERSRERIAELEAIANISDARPGEERLVASVVNRTVSPFTEVISIDKGSSSGIRVGMVVLSAQGTLIGSVTDVFRDRAFVRTINDSRSRVIAESLETHVEGTVEGTADRVLELKLATGAVNVGETIVTSALSGRFPADIPIAIVAEVEGSPQDFHPRVRLEPLVRISRATTVLVITSFLPDETPAGAEP
jgi:rod shape-determining protein MreC